MEKHYLWRVVDHEGEVRECIVTRHRNKRAALKFLNKAMKKHGVVTDKLASYGAALKKLGIVDIQDTGDKRIVRKPTLTFQAKRTIDA